MRNLEVTARFSADGASEGEIHRKSEVRASIVGRLVISEKAYLGGCASLCSPRVESAKST